MARKSKYDDEIYKNSGSVGYSQAALEKLNAGTYGRDIGSKRQMQYRTSQEQTQQSRQLPVLEGVIANEPSSQEWESSFGRNKSNGIGVDTGRARRKYEQKIGHVADDFRNLRNRGYESSYNTIDFSNISNTDTELLESALSKRESQRKRNEKLRTYAPDSVGAKVLNWEQSLLDVDPLDEIAERQAYINTYGKSKDEVLDAYEIYKETKERKEREEHPIKAGLKDIPSAPTRALANAAGIISREFFPYSDLDQIANSDLIQGKVKEVNKNRDYTYDSNKLSDTEKGVAKFVNEGGDFAADTLVSLFTGTPLAIGDAAAGFGLTAELAPWIPQLLNTGMGYGEAAGTTKHDLERRGVDEDKANSFANVTGLIGAGSRVATALKGASKVGESVLENILSSAKFAGTLGLGKQAIKEVADAIILGDQGNIQTDIQRFTAQGMTENKAIQKAVLNSFGRIGVSGILDAIAGAGYGVLSGIGGRNVATEDNLNSAWATQDALEGETYPRLTGSVENTSSLNGTTYNVPALVDNIYPIQMPGTNGTIYLTGETLPIELPDLSAQTQSVGNAVNKVMAERVAQTPRLTAPLTGVAKEQAETRVDVINRTIKTNKNTIAEYNDLAKKGKNNRERTKYANKAKELEKENETLKAERTDLNRQLKGELAPIKELLPEEILDDVASLKKEIRKVRDMYVSDENKHLAEDAIIALDNFIQSGDMHDYNEFYNNVMSLQKAATETYINKTDPEISSTYGKYHSDADGTSLGEMVALVRKDGSYGRNATKLIPTVKDFVRQQEATAVPNLPSTSEVRPEITPTDVTNGERLVSKVNSVANGNTVEPDGFVPTRYENGTGVDLPTEKAIKNDSFRIKKNPPKADYANENVPQSLRPKTNNESDPFDDNISPNAQNVNSSSATTLTNNNNNAQGYWLRVLGDDSFATEQAEQNNTTVQTLREYAAKNLGLSPTVSNNAPQNDVPHADGTMPGDGKKTSQYYKNTMRNTEENSKMSDEEYATKFNEEEYNYDQTTNKDSEAEGRAFISKAGGHDGAVKEILNGNFDENRPFTHAHVDAVHILADEAEKEARNLEAQGIDASDKWLEAHRLHKKMRAENTRSAQVLQANQKWSKKTPQGALDNLIMETNKNIDKKKTKGYTAMVDNLADNVEDAIRNNKGADRVNALRDIFSRNRDNSDYKTDKYEQLVLDLVGGESANKKSPADLAEEAGSIIRKNMGVSSLTMKQERAILNLLEEATRYEEGSRSYKECIAQAMKIYDSTLPSSIGDKIKSFWYDNMLFSIKTMITRNLGGNVLANAVENIATPLQVGADWLVGKATGNRTRTMSGKALIEGTKGFGHGVKDWYLDVRQGVNTTRSGQESLNDALKAASTTFKTTSDNDFLKFINAAGSVYDRVVRKGMELGDRPIYEAKYAATKAELQAVVDKFGEEGIRKGLPKGDYSIDDVIELISVNDALEAVLQNDTSMKEGMQNAKKFLAKTSESLVGTDVASMVMPFIEVSGNMADRYFQYTPFGIVGNIVRSVREKLKTGAVNQRRFTGEIGRNILGGLMTAGGLALASKGYISDAQSEDQDEKKLQQLNNYQEYALQTKDGETQIDLSDVPIIGPKLIESKMLYDAYKEKGIPGLVPKLPTAVGAATLDSLFQGLNKVTGGNSKYGSGNGNFIGNLGEAIKSLPTSLTIPQVVRQTAQFTDPYKRDLGDYGTDEYNKNSFINGIPILREMMLNPKIDTAGNPVKELGGESGFRRFMDAYVTPWKTSHPKENMSNAQLYGMMLKEKTNGAVNPQLPVFKASDLKTIKGYDAESYTHDDLYEIDKKLYASNDELANVLIGNDWFTSLPYERQGQYLDKLYAANKENVKEDFVREGMTEQEIIDAGDSLYKADDKLAKILRADDESHSGMFEYFQNVDGIANLEEKYGYKMDYDTYVNWNTDDEKKKLGGAEKYAEVHDTAKALDMAVDDYLNYEKNYNGGATQRAEDKNNAVNLGFVDKDGSVNLDAYNKAVSIVGSSVPKLIAYKEIRQYTKNAQLVPALVNNSTFSDDEKGQIIMAQHGYKYADLGATAKGTYDREGAAGVYYFYLLQNLADTDGNGSVNKAEKEALLNSDNPYVTQLSDDMYYYLDGANW